MTTRQPFIDRDFYSDPRRRLRSGIVRALSRPMRRAGFDFELRSFYSPIPNTELIPDQRWRRSSPMPGIEFDLERQFAYVEGELAPAIAEFKPPRQPTGDRFAYHLDNGLFQGGDADLLYAVIRHHRPARVLELGAGFSTLVGAMAARANRDDGHETRLRSCDPYANGGGAAQVDGLEAIIPVAAEELSADLFSELAAGDVLFIDSSHTVRIGGDVVHLFCEVIPQLAPGVLVHVHDVYLPYEYPREWMDRMRWYWAEQYLLQALLVGNDRLEVLAGAYALWRADPERLRAAIPNLDPAHPPISFWMRVRD
jgi:predicted O-methyltransferase YrrM